MNPEHPLTDAAVLATEHSFFEALLFADRVGLDQVLADDFLLVDVMGAATSTCTWQPMTVGGY